MKTTDVKPDSYAEYSVEFNEKDLSFKVGNHVRILRYKSIFAEGYAPNWPEKAFIIRKIKKSVAWNFVISDLNDDW